MSEIERFKRHCREMYQAEQAEQDEPRRMRSALEALRERIDSDTDPLWVREYIDRVLAGREACEACLSDEPAFVVDILYITEEGMRATPAPGNRRRLCIDCTKGYAKPSPPVPGHVLGWRMEVRRI